MVGSLKLLCMSALRTDMVAQCLAGALDCKGNGYMTGSCYWAFPTSSLMSISCWRQSVIRIWIISWSWNACSACISFTASRLTVLQLGASDNLPKSVSRQIWNLKKDSLVIKQQVCNRVPKKACMVMSDLCEKYSEIRISLPANMCRHRNCTYPLHQELAACIPCFFKSHASPTETIVVQS